MSTDWAQPRAPVSKKTGAKKTGAKNPGAKNPDSKNFDSKKWAKSKAQFDGNDAGEHAGSGAGVPLTDAARKRLNDASSDGGFAKCMASGVRLLAGREYSVLELTSKLARRFNGEVVEAVIHELTSQHLLDDSRYAEAFCRIRVERGYGPGFILRELQQNGLDPELTESVLSAYEEQWFERAVAQVRKAHRPAKKPLQRGSWQEGPDGHDDADTDDAYVDSDEGVGDDLGEGPAARGRWGRGTGRRNQAWEQSQKERGRLARMLARRGFSGSLAGKAIDLVLKEAAGEGSWDGD